MLTGTILPDLFKTEERVRILDYVSKRESVTATNVIKETGASKASVSRYLHLLVRAGLLENKNRDYYWKETAICAAVKRLMNIELLSGTIDLPEWAKAIGVYGSFAQGTNTVESDVDLWIYIPEYRRDSEIKTAELEKEIRDRTGHEIHILILTEEKLSHLKENDPPFYTRLTETSVIIKGESYVGN
ncbi:transcriptional regulator, ArsR family [Methanolacinia petrolearia DSM 11571]|uniref:protein adenylyltransferase n=3 Tax=Methanolacinia TaxID=230355 RepID=E1RD96_METP4|nr:nucleotidyltransferase domain-containing protein [Methanolacinia petrolearia]ADN37079.1 transcriptional regulator, ArsR family [Methanolacinia petrolearia DSM 11571]